MTWQDKWNIEKGSFETHPHIEEGKVDGERREKENASIKKGERDGGVAQIDTYA